jgi:hypothetical protein
MLSMSVPQHLAVVLIVAVVMTASEPVVYAQTPGASGAQRRGQIFVSNGAKLKRAGGTRSMLHFGFGMEWLLPSGLGLGFEAGPRFEDHDFMRLDDIMLSADVSYHPRAKARAMRLDPFLNGGFSLGVEPVSDGQQTPFLSVGAGVTYWWSARRGIRLELRDAVTLGKPQTGYHHLGFRVGYEWLIGLK